MEAHLTLITNYPVYFLKLFLTKLHTVILKKVYVIGQCIWVTYPRPTAALGPRDHEG